MRRVSKHESHPAAQASMQAFARALMADAQGQQDSLKLLDSMLGDPNARQQEFLDFVRAQRHNRLFYGGARGGGKSWALLRAVMERRYTFPRSRGLLLRRTYSEVFDNHVSQLLRKLPPSEYTYNAQHSRITFRNGSVQDFAYCASDGDVLRYHGLEYDDIAIDELEQWLERWYDELTGSCRSTRRDLRPLMLGSGMPGGIGHAWCKRRWVGRDFRAGENPDEYAFVPARVYDNPVIVDNDPDYIRGLEALPDALRRAWLDGDWDVVAGLFFAGQFRSVPHETERAHVIPTQDVPANWALYSSIDYGFHPRTDAEKPFVYQLYAVRPDGKIILVDELAAARWDVRTQKQKIADLEGRYVQRVVCRVGCRSMFGKREEHGPTIAEEYQSPQKDGICLGVIPSEDNHLAGWERCRLWLRSDETGEPFFQVFDRCRNFIGTVESVPCDERHPDDIDPNADDHAVEAWRHFLMSRPTPMRPPDPPPHPRSAEAARLRERARRLRMRR